MGFNQLPAGYDRAKLGPQKRRTRFKSEGAKLACDAQRLIERAELQSKRLGRSVDPITFAQRKDDNLEALQAAIDAEQGAVQVPIEAVLLGAEELRTDVSPEQIWLDGLQLHFNALPQLHTGIEWSDVERSLRADPESMRKLQALDKKGHQMNVFGEEEGKFIFVSAWSDYEQVASDHRNIVYDKRAERCYAFFRGNGNAVSIIARIMGVEEDEAGNYLADPKFHEQLRRVIAVKGSAWLKTDTATREIGRAFYGDSHGFFKPEAHAYGRSNSFRAELRVKKV